MTTLSVVVPATDDPPTLPHCRAAIARAADGPDEVIVVEGPTELSASGARNLGVERASGSIVVFVDADVEVHPDAFTRIRATFADDDSLTALYGSYDDGPDASSTVSTFRNLLHHHVHQVGAGPVETFWTGLGAVRRDAFTRVGGFDEARYPHPSIEDIDLGHRLTDAGAVIRLEPRVQGTHLKAWTLRSMVGTDFARRGVPWVALQARRRQPSNALNCGRRHRLSAASCALGVMGAALLHPLVAVAAIGTMVVLNHAFYALLLRRQGPLRAAAGVALHGVHHLVAVAALVAGLAVAVVEASATARRRVPIRPTPSSEGARP